MKKYRVTYFVYGLFNGGVESFLYNYLSNMNLENFEITIITQSKSEESCKNKFERIGATIYEVPTKKNILKYFKMVRKILKERKCNIVHSNMGFSNFFPSLIAKICNINIRISHSHIYKTNKLNIKEKILKVLNLKFSNYYFACGEKAGEYLYGKNKDFKVIYNSIDTEKYKFSVETREKMKKLLFLEEKNVYGNVGRFDTQKNQIFLLEIFRDILLRDSRAHLLIIGGEGDKEDIIIEKIRKLNIQNSVTLLKNRKDVNDLYQAMDIFLLPSLYEGFPVVAIETQTNGLYTIMSDTITKEAKISDKGKYVSLQDKEEWVNEALKYVEKSKNLEKRQQEFENISSTLFNIKNSAAKLEEIYKELYEERKKDE